MTWLYKIAGTTAAVSGLLAWSRVSDQRESTPVSSLRRSLDTTSTDYLDEERADVFEDTSSEELAVDLRTINTHEQAFKEAKRRNLQEMRGSVVTPVYHEAVAESGTLELVASAAATTGSRVMEQELPIAPKKRVKPKLKHLSVAELFALYKKKSLYRTELLMGGAVTAIQTGTPVGVAFGKAGFTTGVKMLASPMNKFITNYVAKGLSSAEAFQIMMKNPYKGAGVTGVSSFGEFLVAFYTAEKMRDFMIARGADEETAANLSRGFGGMLSALAMNPMEVYRTHLQTNANCKLAIRDFFAAAHIEALRKGGTFGIGLYLGDVVYDKAKDHLGEGYPTFIASKVSSWVLLSVIGAPLFNCARKTWGDPHNIRSVGDYLKLLGIGGFNPKSLTPKQASAYGVKSGRVLTGEGKKAYDLWMANNRGQYILEMTRLLNNTPRYNPLKRLGIKASIQSVAEDGGKINWGYLLRHGGRNFSLTVRGTHFGIFAMAIVGGGIASVEYLVNNIREEAMREET